MITELPRAYQHSMSTLSRKSVLILQLSTKSSQADSGGGLVMSIASGSSANLSLPANLFFDSSKYRESLICTVEVLFCSRGFFSQSLSIRSIQT